MAANDLVNLQEQYGKDQFPAIFPEKITDGSKVDYQGRNYLASFAGTIHAGWSVFFFRPVEMVGAYRLTGIAVACILAILALVILGRNFYSKDHALASTGRFRAMFDAAPEAIGVIDPDALKIVEANSSLAACLGYTQTELLALNLGQLFNQDSQEIRPWLLKIIRDDGAAKIKWQARRKDGSSVELEVMGSKLEHQGRDQVLIFCRAVEALAHPPPPSFRRPAKSRRSREPRIASLPARSDFREPHDAIKNILPHLKENRPDENVEDFDHETKVLINRIKTALDKAEKLRKNSGDRQNL